MKPGRPSGGRKTQGQVLGDGLNLGASMCKLVKWRNAWTQVILLTGASSLPAVEDALEADACEFLLKPVDLDELGRVLDQATERFSRWTVAMKETLRQQLA